MLDLRLDVPELEPDPRLLAELSARSAGAAPASAGTGRVLLAAASVAAVAGVSWLAGALPGTHSPLSPEPVHRPAPSTGVTRSPDPSPLGAAATPPSAAAAPGATTGPGRGAAGSTGSGVRPHLTTPPPTTPPTSRPPGKDHDQPHHTGKPTQAPRPTKPPRPVHPTHPVHPAHPAHPAHAQGGGAGGKGRQR